MLLLFFFFKQKTAYEMRISDWSSDVCSSDLLLDIINDILDLAKIEVGKFELHDEDCDVAAVIPSALRFVRDRAHASGLKIEMQIGRASCRERVCQYV